MNGTPHKPEDTAVAGSSSLLNFSDTDGDDDTQDDHGGDYSARFEELMSDDEDGSAHSEDEEEEDGFVYEGVDADPAGSYRDQLRDVLGADHEEDELESVADRRSLAQAIADSERFATAMDDEAIRHDLMSDESRSASPVSPNGFLSPPNASGSGTPPPPHLRRPFLHPTVSRLRSTTPQASRVPSAAGAHNIPVEDVSAVHSHFSDLSRHTDNARDTASQTNGKPEEEREVFRWTELHTIGDYLYRNAAPSSKAAAVLGTPEVGSPTVLTANGLICVGTDVGRILVFDFKQNLMCVCGEDSQLGAVTALALSFDHTFVAAGHATGYIQLYNLKNPKSPARFVAPTSMAAVASGRQEGHLLGSRIVSIGFVAGRHTAVVSADETGLAFYHSLGKVLFVEASDILRILGKYPDDTMPDTVPTPTMALPTPYQHTFRRRKQRKVNTILSMAPLPLGTLAHPTDTYNLIALLTPVKLVIVGLRPTPRTWYRQHRESEDDVPAKSRFKGSLAWFPSVAASEKEELNPASHKQNGTSSQPLAPVLAYSWGNTLRLIRVFETRVTEKVKNPKNGKISTVESGRIVFEEGGHWNTEGDILLLQWLNANQLLILTAGTLEVYDVRTLKLVDKVPFESWALVSPVLSHTTNGSISYSDAVTEVAHSIRVYKGKIFCLGQHNISVGTLLTWADRILTFVSHGDFLSAINLTLTYYTGKARGNRNGLPEKPEDIRVVIGGKLRELMVASASYAFSEERLTDGTHVTPDGRGVDRTDLFEGLVVSCARACIALADFDFLFEELYQYYFENGITRMFLLQLEPFILDNSTHQVPPRITQLLIALHHEDSRPDLVERVIWHIDPDCLDIEQAITLCQSYRLYDALIYVYTRAMKDYVAPVVELMGLIRKINQRRRALVMGSPTFVTPATDDAMEADIMNAYKIYPYLANTLTGLTYPSERPLPEDEAFRAKDSVYRFLFFGRSRVWPEDEGGKLVLTSDDEIGDEPTYPYTRLLLRFDAEAFLHTLDIAFEDSILNDEKRSVNRLVITKILFEILSTSSLSPSDATFINIFIARNVPTYSQYIHLTPSALQGILIGLAESHDEDTREDRQLAAEYLLSAYTPHDSHHILHLFELAGFYRILRSWHRTEQQWIPLIQTYLQDPDYPPQEVFSSIQDVITTVTRLNKGTLPLEVLSTIEESLPRLLQINIPRTASFLDKLIPDLHEEALAALGPDAHDQRFTYLRYLLGSPYSQETSAESGEYHRVGPPSTHAPSPLRQEYLSLLCQQDPSNVIRELEYLPADCINWEKVLETCEQYRVYDAVIWSLNYRGDPIASVAKAASLDRALSTDVVHALKQDVPQADKLEALLDSLQTVARAAVAVCQGHSQVVDSDVPLDNLWFTVLESQIAAVHKVSVCCSREASSAVPIAQAKTADSDAPPTSTDLERKAIETLRSLVQTTFTTLMSVSTTKAKQTVSFPVLFKRLVSGAAASGQGAVYDEFRVILTGMLESYRSDGDLLGITRQILERDFYEVVEECSRERIRGWGPAMGDKRRCWGCRKTVFKEEGDQGGKVVVSRTGAIYHDRCLPPDFDA